MLLLRTNVNHLRLTVTPPPASVISIRLLLHYLQIILNTTNTIQTQQRNNQNSLVDIQLILFITAELFIIASTTIARTNCRNRL